MRLLERFPNSHGYSGTARNLARLRQFAATMLVLAGILGCGGGGGLNHEAQSPEITHALDAADIRQLDLRFQDGEIVLSQSEDERFTVGGTITVRADDGATAKLKAAQADLVITSGKFTLLTLPPNTPDVEYKVAFEIGIPRNVDLRVIVPGMGNVAGQFELPAKTEIQVGSGTVELNLPRDTSARLSLQSNQGGVAVEKFEVQSGEVRRQLIYSEFNGSVGRMGTLSGKSLNVSVNIGDITVRGRESKDASK